MLAVTAEIVNRVFQGLHQQLRETCYFKSSIDFCKNHHDDVELREAVRKLAVDRADETGDGPIVPIVEMDKFFYQRPAPRTIAELNHGLVSGLSSSLSPVSHWRHCHRAQEEEELY